MPLELLGVRAPMDFATGVIHNDAPDYQVAGAAESHGPCLPGFRDKI